MRASPEEPGLRNPHRVARLMAEAIGTWQLDLDGLVVLTEAASGYYATTSVLAALAGARRVIAITRDSDYASATQVVSQTRTLEKLCGLPESVEVRGSRNTSLFAEADIITNLGFVRPIDAQAVASMKPTAVVPLMCEAWEVRPEDVDLRACVDRGILAVGTDESARGLGVFEYCGPLCTKMLLEAGLEVYRNRIVIVSSDRFGEVLERSLTSLGAEARRVNPRELSERPEVLAACDAVVLADYRYPGRLIGQGTPVPAALLKELAPEAVIVQFAGGVDAGELRRNDLQVVPPRSVPPLRMGCTFSELGPKPVVDLHIAGLKVGEVAARARLSGLTVEQAQALVLQNAPSQLVQADDAVESRGARVTEVSRTP